MQPVVLEQALDRRAAEVGEVDVEHVCQVTHHGIALGGGAHEAGGEVGRLIREIQLRLVDRGDRGVDQLHVDRDTPVVDLLVEQPQLALGRGPVPLGDPLVDRAHGLDVEARIVHELPPILGVRLARGPAKLLVLGARHAEQIDQPPAVLVLRLVHRNVQDVAELRERAGQGMRQGEDHRVDDLLGRDLDVIVPGNGAIEM